MKKYNVLILTDHSNHSSENALYALANEMLQHKLTAKIDVLSRANAKNAAFFQGEDKAKIFVSSINKHFSYTEDGSFLSNNLRSVNSGAYDLIWLRLPPLSIRISWIISMIILRIK